MDRGSSGENRTRRRLLYTLYSVLVVVQDDRRSRTLAPPLLVHSPYTSQQYIVRTKTRIAPRAPRVASRRSRGHTTRDRTPSRDPASTSRLHSLGRGGVFTDATGAYAGLAVTPRSVGTLPVDPAAAPAKDLAARDASLASRRAPGTPGSCEAGLGARIRRRVTPSRSRLGCINELTRVPLAKSF